MKSLLIIFVKNPILGKVKTRIAKTLGEKAALKIYNALLLKTKKEVTSLKNDIYVYYSDTIILSDIWDTIASQKKIQKGKELGERMYNAFYESFQLGYNKICIIGTDLWDIKSDDISKTFTALEKNDVVIGPANDGGYYLLGLKEPIKKIFQNKKWGKNDVLSDTLNDLKEKVVKLLSPKNDIDFEKDVRNIPELNRFIV